MKYSQVLNLISEANMTFEEIAPTLGVSNMTLRRWEKKPKGTLVPYPYQCAIREGVYQLLIDGHIKGDSKNVQAILEGVPSKSFEAAIKSLGVSEITESKEMSNEGQMTMVLAEIGQNKEHIQEVDRSHTEILKFRSFGANWNRYISILMKVVRSKDLFALDKLVAYGALFYLIFPLDLIPDSIPVVGYTDDFAFLAIAAMFYIKKFPDLSENLTEQGATS